MPINGTHSMYGTNSLITALQNRCFNIVSDVLVRKAEQDLGFQAEHKIFPDGPSIYAKSSKFAMAHRLGASTFFAEVSDSFGISNDSFSGAHLHLELIKIDSGKLLWNKEYIPGFWTTAITANGNSKSGMKELPKLLHSMKNNWAINFDCPI